MATKKTSDWADDVVARENSKPRDWAETADYLPYDYINERRQQEFPEAVELANDRGLGISDTAVGLGKGGVDLVKDLSGVVAWGANAVGIEDDPNKGILDESLNRASAYLQSKKSQEIRDKEAELSRLISDDNYSVGDVAAYVASNPSLAIQMGAEALPGMVAMAAGGAGAASKLNFVKSANPAGSGAWPPPRAWVVGWKVSKWLGRFITTPRIVGPQRWLWVLALSQVWHLAT
jgi:hypothetical protein